MGGTSSISGQVLGSEFSFAEQEITEVIISSGNTVEHGDYWVLNTESTAAYYYIWYDNPTWTSNGDPGLNGRIGVPVTYNYSDSNTEIATNTADAINAATTAFDIEILNDILRITAVVAGDVPDADKITSPFEINIENQGKNNVSLSQSPVIDEKVYIKYGTSTFSNDDVRTTENGQFHFTGLTKGRYEVFVFTKDTLTDQLSTISQQITISDKKADFSLDNFEIMH